MKRLISLLLSVITILSCFALGSCADPEAGPDTADTSAIESIEDAPDVVIATGEEPVYSLIRYIDAGSDEVDLIIDFKNDLNAKFNMTFPISAESCSRPRRTRNHHRSYRQRSYFSDS